MTYLSRGAAVTIGCWQKSSIPRLVKLAAMYLAGLTCDLGCQLPGKILAFLSEPVHVERKVTADGVGVGG